VTPFRALLADRGLLPEGRLAGPMPYVIAIMTFLTVLAVAAGMALGASAGSLGRDLAGRLTVQIVEANPDAREAQAKAALGELGRLAAVARAERVDEVRMRALLEPWLGKEGLDGDLPIPVLIDVTLATDDSRGLADIAQSLRTTAPSARVEPHARFLAPVTGLLSTLRWLAVGLVVLMAAATAAAVVLAARAALDTHRATIDVMHLMGASDSRVARLFQRRAALDAIFGSAIGFVLGVLVVVFVGNSLAAVDAVIVAGGTLGWVGWLAVLLVPVGAVVLATLTARVAILRALGNAL
jgi:cell division transport system permease protein